MAFVAYRTWTTGELVTGSHMNEQVRDNGDFVASGHGVKAYLSADTTALDSTDKIIGFAAEEFDTDGYHDNVTNNSRLTIPTGLGGLYAMIASVFWETNATGRRRQQIVKNGTTPLGGSIFTGSATSTANHFPASAMAVLVAGDYLQLICTQNSTATRTITNGSEFTFLSAVRIGK